MDHGYPQLTAVNILSGFIKHGQLKSATPGSGEVVEAKDPSMMTGEITGKCYRRAWVVVDRDMDLEVEGGRKSWNMEWKYWKRSKGEVVGGEM